MSEKPRKGLDQPSMMSVRFVEESIEAMEMGTQACCIVWVCPFLSKRLL